LVDLVAQVDLFSTAPYEVSRTEKSPASSYALIRTRSATSTWSTSAVAASGD